MTMPHVPQGREYVFRPVNTMRWRRGLRQSDGRRWQGWALAVLPLVLVAVVAWSAGETLAQVWGRPGVRNLLASQLPVILLAAYMAPIAAWALDGRRLVVTATHLRLRHRWAWLDRLLGWRMPLHEVAQSARWVHGAPGRAQVPDRLLQMALELPLPQDTAWRWARPRRLLVPVGWALERDGRADPGPWPQPAVQPTAMQVFLMRPPAWDAAALHDLDERLAQLPLLRVLREQGVRLPRLGDAGDIPARLGAAGQLALDQVPSLRRGMYALAGLGVAGAAVLLMNDRWHFFSTPWPLYLAAGLACAVVCAGLLWPRELAPQTGVAPGSARLQAVAATVFMGALCGALLAWLLSNALLWRMVQRQPVQTMAFALDKSGMGSGPVLLRPVEAGGTPAIEIGTGRWFWREQPEGVRWELPVVRAPWGGLWAYDSAPIVEVMRKKAGR